jgi:hypothetical protein
MKRAHDTRAAYGSGNILRDVSKRQLANIGAVSIAYNEMEEALDLLLIFSLGIWANVGPQVTSRINGADGKIAIVKAAMRDMSSLKGISGYVVGSPGFGELLEKSLEHEGFALLKQHRDAVIHAHKFDVPTAIALTSVKRGKPYEVLMTADALKALYDRLVLVRNELWEACTIVARASDSFKAFWVAHNIGAVNSPVGKKLFLSTKAQTERDIRGAIFRYRRHQSRRLSLPPLPSFPSEAQLAQARSQWLKAHEEWFGWTPHLSSRRLHPALFGWLRPHRKKKRK